MSARLDQLLDNDLAFGDEHPLATDEVALANVAICLNPRIGGIGDGDQQRHEIPMEGAVLAERVGFEPTVGVNPRRFSRPLP